MKVLAIRRAAETDVPELARIYNQALVERNATADMEPRTLEDRKQWFEKFSDRHPLWVGEEEGRVVCYGGLTPYSSREGYRFAAENTVYVAQEARGRGNGKTMLVHLISEARKLGLHYILARIFSHNEASLWLHAELGFKKLGIQRKIVEMDGRWYDVTLMDINL
jgi:L-amino acid N-acyltransferase